jgi:hypothetical protein
MTTKATVGAELPAIYSIRKQKVVIDSELAKLYGVAVKALNQAVQRNTDRFPEDFCFYLSNEEVAELKSQIVTSSGRGDQGTKDPFARTENRHGGRRKPPRVFTEHGALMAANVLRSERAIEMSVYLIRAFVQMRETILANTTILKRLAEIDRRLIEHDSVLREVIEQLQPLLDAPEVDEEGKPKIGFHRGNR